MDRNALEVEEIMAASVSLMKYAPYGRCYGTPIKPTYKAASWVNSRVMIGCARAGFAKLLDSTRLITN